MIYLANSFCHLLFLMAAGHAIADRPLQEGSIRADKYAPRDQGNYRWLFGLACHGLIHGGFVALITGLWWLGAAETIAHAWIDNLTLTKRIGLMADQGLHAGCKIAWAAIAISLI